MSEYSLSYWGQFADKQTESSYTKSIYSDILKRNQLGILVAGTGYLLVAFADYAKMGFSSGFYYAAGFRFLYFIICATVFLFLKTKPDIQKVYRLSFLITLLNSVLILAVIYVLNPDKEIDTIDIITVPIVTLLFYIFMNIPLGFHLINGALVTTVYVLMLITVYSNSTDTIINIFVIMLVINVMGIFAVRFLNISKRKEYANREIIIELNENLTQEIEERIATQQKLENTLQQITSSIKYAQKIQIALLPRVSNIKQDFNDYFIFYKPRNIVSGDFYWAHRIHNKSIIAVADCTGHGIPGAFMSILGISLLNEIVKNAMHDQTEIRSNEILDKLRTAVMLTMQQTGKNEQRDGMDIALAVIDRENKVIEFSGAYNPLWHISKNESGFVLNEFIADKTPVGWHITKVKPFSSQKFSYSDGDCIYLCTDGYQDQFGGPYGHKFLSKNFKNLLLSIQDKNMQEQKKIIYENFISWKGNLNTQVDDVLVLGIKL